MVAQSLRAEFSCQASGLEGLALCPIPGSSLGGWIEQSQEDEVWQLPRILGRGYWGRGRSIRTMARTGAEVALGGPVAWALVLCPKKLLASQIYRSLERGQDGKGQVEGSGGGRRKEFWLSAGHCSI